MYGHTARVSFTHTVLPPAHKMCCKLSLRILGVFGKLVFFGLEIKEAGDGLRQHVRLEFKQEGQSHLSNSGTSC